MHLSPKLKIYLIKNKNNNNSNINYYTKNKQTNNKSNNKIYCFDNNQSKFQLQFFF